MDFFLTFLKFEGCSASDLQRKKIEFNQAELFPNVSFK